MIVGIADQELIVLFTFSFEQSLCAENNCFFFFGSFYTFEWSMLRMDQSLLHAPIKVWLAPLVTLSDPTSMRRWTTVLLPFAVLVWSNGLVGATDFEIEVRTTNPTVL